MPPRPLSRLLPLGVLAVLSLGHTEGGGGGGCGDSGDSGHHQGHGRSSGAVCPPEGRPTAASFGRAFLETHCLPCHSASVTGPARQGAPPGVDFDTPEAVRLWAEAIDSHSAAGPSAVNTSMPPASRHAPSRDERVRLGQWLSCGAP